MNIIELHINLRKLMKSLEMKKKQELKNVSFLTETSLVNGILKINDQNCGISSMVNITMVNTSFSVQPMSMNPNSTAYWPDVGPTSE